jgi:hypothetical protein
MRYAHARRCRALEFRRRRNVESTIEERLADECDLGLDQLSRWSGVPWARVRAWAEREVDITDEETSRLYSVIGLAQAYYQRCELLAEALDNAYGETGENGSAHR